MSGSDDGKKPDFLRPGGILEGPLFQGFLRSLSGVAEPDPGMRLGPWRVVRELGRGGSGVVFLAERADGAFTREVALKWLRADRPPAGGFRALERERELLASLDHPNIARLVDGGQTEEGMLWFIMDLVCGKALDEHARGRPLAERVSLIQRLCDAVHHAHRRGLIHGDIKPSNVRVDERGEPRLLDFGIARFAGSDAGSGYGLTPEYASPEQRAGQTLTTASDVWQLGRLLDHLCGPGARSADLAAIVQRATARDPARRYASAAALAADLEAWQGRFPVAARNGGGLYRFSRLFRRNLALCLLALVALALLFGGGIGATIQLAAERDSARAEAERASEALDEAEEALRRAEGLRDFLVGLFRAAEPERPREELPSTGELLSVGARRALDGQSGHPAERMDMLATIAEVYMTLGRRDEAWPLLARAATVPVADGPESLTRVLVLQARLARTSGRMEAADALALAAEARVTGQPGTDDAFALARAWRGTLAYMANRPDEGLALLAGLREWVETDPEMVASRTRLRLLETLGAIHHFRGDYGAAMEIRLQALGLVESLEGPESRRYGFHRSTLADSRMRLGEFDRAEVDLEVVMDLYERIYDRATVRRGATAMSLADLYLRTGRLNQARATLGRALEEWASARGRSFFQQTAGNQHYARMLMDVGRVEKVEPILVRALARLERAASAGEADRVRAWLAEARCRQGRPARGKAVLLDIGQRESRRDSSGPGDGGDEASMDVDLARAICRHAAGRHSGALEAMERVLEQPLPRGDAFVRAGHYRLKAEILKADARPDRAQQARQRVRVVLALAGLPRLYPPEG